jgi:hypothetical protein
MKQNGRTSMISREPASKVQILETKQKSLHPVGDKGFFAKT